MPGLGIGDRAGIALGRAIGHLDLSLETIDLSENCLDNESLCVIVKALEAQPHIVKMNLSRNRFKAEASAALEALLAPVQDLKKPKLPAHPHLNDTLEILILRDCGLKLHTLKAMMNHISEHHLPHLHTLDVASNNLSECEDSLARLVYSNLPNFTDLNISWACIGGHEALEMAKAFAVFFRIV